MAKKAKRVERFEVSKVKSGEGKHAYKVMVHHHPTPSKEGRGLKGAMPEYHRPEEHMHPSRHAAQRHVGQLMNQMSVNPEGDDDDGDEGVGQEGPGDALEQSGPPQPNDLE